MTGRHRRQKRRAPFLGQKGEQGRRIVWLQCVERRRQNGNRQTRQRELDRFGARVHQRLAELVRREMLHDRDAVLTLDLAEELREIGGVKRSETFAQRLGIMPRDLHDVGGQQRRDFHAAGKIPPASELDEQRDAVPNH